MTLTTVDCTITAILLQLSHHAVHAQVVRLPLLFLVLEGLIVFFEKGESMSLIWNMF